MRDFWPLLNNMDLHEYMGGYVPPHWHGELELFELFEGLVSVRIEDQSYELESRGGMLYQHQRSFMLLFRKPPLPTCSAPLCSALHDLWNPGKCISHQYMRPLLENGPSFFVFHNTWGRSVFSGIWLSPPCLYQWKLRIWISGTECAVQYPLPFVLSKMSVDSSLLLFLRYKTQNAP